MSLTGIPMGDSAESPLGDSDWNRVLFKNVHPPPIYHQLPVEVVRRPRNHIVVASVRRGRLLAPRDVMADGQKCIRPAGD